MSKKIPITETYLKILQKGDDKKTALQTTAEALNLALARLGYHLESKKK